MKVTETIGQKSGERKRSHNPTLAEINVIPLVDIILVLLIIFMVTAPLLEQGLDVQLPQAESPAIERTEDDVFLTINAKGGLFLMDDPTPYSLEDLEKKLVAAFEKRERKEIFIRADRQVIYGRVAQAMATIRKAGIERIGMITEEPERSR